MTIVLTSLCHGRQLQAMVAAFYWDERTVAAWQLRAGQHCQHMHKMMQATTKFRPVAYLARLETQFLPPTSPP